jgi:hypothetical protein
MHEASFTVRVNQREPRERLVVGCILLGPGEHVRDIRAADPARRGGAVIRRSGSLGVAACRG